MPCLLCRYCRTCLPASVKVLPSKNVRCPTCSDPGSTLLSNTHNRSNGTEALRSTSTPSVISDRDEKRGRKRASIGSDGRSVSCVTDCRTKDLGDGRTVREYNVRWEGHTDEFNSWELISSLDSFESIKLYLQQQVVRQVPHVRHVLAT
jgi:hypothetical protein